ncbi:MAG: TlpA family protein disulfide reductase [Cyclobacteriaceae bacterium]|jgi:hypothetical protein
MGIGRHLKLFLFLGFAVAILVFGYSVYNQVRVKNESNKATMINCALLDLDSSRYELPKTPHAIIFFDPDCESCKYELQDLKENEMLFKNKKVVLLSTLSIRTIKKVAQDYGLTDADFANFAKIDANDALEAFGSVALPYILIYGANGQLVKEYKGETSAELIAKYLRDN